MYVSFIETTITWSPNSILSVLSFTMNFAVELLPLPVKPSKTTASSKDCRHSSPAALYPSLMQGTKLLLFNYEIPLFYIAHMYDILVTLCSSNSSIIKDSEVKKDNITAKLKIKFVHHLSNRRAN
jgi:hypothetical protein